MEIRTRLDNDEVTEMAKRSRWRGGRRDVDGGEGRKAEGRVAQNTYHQSLWVGGQDQFSQSL